MLFFHEPKKKNICITVNKNNAKQFLFYSATMMELYALHALNTNDSSNANCGKRNKMSKKGQGNTLSDGLSHRLVSDCDCHLRVQTGAVRKNNHKNRRHTRLHPFTNLVLDSKVDEGPFIPDSRGHARLNPLTY